MHGVLLSYLFTYTAAHVCITSAVCCMHMQGHTNAEWFEHDAQRLGSTEPLSKPAGRVDTAKELRDAGLRTGIEAVKMARQVRQLVTGVKTQKQFSYTVGTCLLQYMLVSAYACDSL